MRWTVAAVSKDLLEVGVRSHLVIDLNRVKSKSNLKVKKHGHQKALPYGRYFVACVSN